MKASRREFLVAGAALGTAIHGAAANKPAFAATAADPDHTGPGLSPDEALELLIRGNQEFLQDKPSHAMIDSKRRIAIARSQTPFAAYVTCSDSRVSPEILFGRGLGELFIIRNAGNTVDAVAMGSIEYAVNNLHVPLVVVMGHERCGAVKAAMDVVESNASYSVNISRMVEPIIPAVLKARSQPGDWYDNSVRANVARVVQQLRTQSSELLDAQNRGEVKIVGAYYDLDTGSVDFFDRP